MKIVIAPDKFKGSLSAAEVAEAIAAGLLEAHPEAEIDLCPMADGGEGTVQAMVQATAGRFVCRRATGPLAEMKIDATFGILGDGKTAVIEMASASGLALLKAEDRNPLNTTTFGTGELLRAAAESGVTHIILGIGGSATCDAGIGCAQGAGLTVLLRDGSPVSTTEPLAGRDLDQVLMVKHARGSPVDRVIITVACDVENPLYGPNGAAMVYGPQKGATAEEVVQMDQIMQRLAERLGKQREANLPGTGAAGGLGFGMMAFFGATLRPGVEIVMDAVDLRGRLYGADWCITGEGKLDRSTLSGKVPAGVARLCREMGVRCIAMGGMAEKSAEIEELFTRVVQIKKATMTEAESVRHARELLSEAGRTVI
jgi:glycerate 2-kinase